MANAKTKFLSATIITIFSFILLAVSSFAATIGDVDADGELKAADARLALRAAVNLENLTKEQFTAADVDCSGDIKSSDARSILRASVQLEQLTRTHKFEDWKVEKKATCTVDGLQTRTCPCGETQTKSIPATGKHTFGKWTVTKKATCTADGLQTRNCACGEKETKKIPATGKHTFGKWTVTKKATCTVDGLQTRKCVCGEKETKKIPAAHAFNVEKPTITQSKVCSRCKFTEAKSFNEYVNPIKTQPHIISYLTTTENTNKITKDTLTKRLRLLLTTLGGYSAAEANAEINALKNELNYTGTTNSIFYKHRTLTNNNYYIKGSELVSELEDSDVVSYTVEKVNAVDFREFLADTHTATDSGFKYDTSGYRYLEADNLVKLTVVLNTEKYSEIKDSDIKKTALMKATGEDIRKIADEELNFNMEDMEGFASADCNEITTDETIIMYIDTENNAPVASCYISSVICEPVFSINFIGLIDGSIEFTTDTKDVSLYFFDDYFA